MGLIEWIGTLGSSRRSAISCRSCSSSPSSCSSTNSAISWWRAGPASRSRRSPSASVRNSSASTTARERAGRSRRSRSAAMSASSATRTRPACRTATRWQQMDPADRERSFAGKGVAARAAIVAAGPIANFLLAIAIFTVIFSIYGREVMTPRVDSVLPDSPAAAAGFQPGDVVESIDGTKISSFSDLQRHGQPLVAARCSTSWCAAATSRSPCRSSRN